MSGDFAADLQGEEEIRITFVDRNGARRMIPVLLCVQESSMEVMLLVCVRNSCFSCLEMKKSLVLAAGWSSISATPKVVRNRAKVEEIKKRFAAKYAKYGDVGKYYPTSEVALEVTIPG